MSHETEGEEQTVPRSVHLGRVYSVPGPGTLRAGQAGDPGTGRWLAWVGELHLRPGQLGKNRGAVHG